MVKNWGEKLFMENLKSVCIIYKEKCCYDAYYLRDFFKWIGFSYFDYCYDGYKENYILLRPEDNNFDVFICLGYEPCDWIEGIRRSFEKSIVLDIKGVEKNITLKTIFKDIINHFNNENQYDILLDIIFKMIKIYNLYNMTGLLYEYTFVLVTNNPHSLSSKLLNKYEIIIKELNKLDCKSSYHYPGKEYYLYAVYSCQSKINELSKYLKKSFPYDTGDSICKLNEIYACDEDFFRVEYLKSKFAVLDDLYKIYVNYYTRECIKNSKVNTCKSFHYYGLGKSLEKNNKRIEAVKEFGLAYNYNKLNTRALFKLALERYHAKDYMTAEKYLLEIISILDITRQNNNADIGFEYIPLMELEYIFKCYMLLAKLSSGSTEDYYYNEAYKISEFVKNNKMKDSFLQKMYGELNLESDIIVSLSSRFQRKRLELIFG